MRIRPAGSSTIISWIPNAQICGVYLIFIASLLTKFRLFLFIFVNTIGHFVYTVNESFYLSLNFSLNTVL